MWFADQGELLNTRPVAPHPRQLSVVGLSGVTRQYGDVEALAGVDLSLSPGITVLLGRNGAGKSTLCRILTGVERPTSGDLTRDGVAVSGIDAWRRHHGQTGWLPQALTVPRSLKVEAYLRYAAWLKDVDRHRTSALVEQALQATDMVELRARRLGTLSGGMVRRLGIAQAIVHQPSLLVLDEPTVGLDPEQRSGFHRIITALGRSTCVLLSTHLLEDVEALADRVVVLDRGLIKFRGAVAELCEHAGDPVVAQSTLRAGFLSIIGGVAP